MKRCNYCVMDDFSDNTISFDEFGQCSYCKKELSKINTTTYFPSNEGEKKLQTIIDTIKQKNKNKQYDCLMGISGGLDSSYLAYLGFKWGLRILAVHIDDGFDTPVSQSNISKLVNAANITLLTIKPDEMQFNDLSKSFMLAGVPNIAIPQDNVLFAFLYRVAIKYKIKYFLSGGNFALECVLQKGNTHSAYDLVHIKDIHRRFGKEKINKLKFISSLRNRAIVYFKGIKTIRPLNYIDYNKERAFKELEEFCGFEYYGAKHLENYYTMFTQLYWMPKKFNVDKRKSHLSSMIVSGQLTRDQALELLKLPMYKDEEMEKCIEIIKNKLKLSNDEFDAIMNAKPKQHEDYRTERLVPFLMRFRNKG